MYDPEESATRLAIGQSLAMKLAFRQLATYMYDTEESAAWLAFCRLATHMYDGRKLQHGWQSVKVRLTTYMYDTEESATRVAIGHLRR